MKKIIFAIAMLLGSAAANAGVFTFGKSSYDVVAGGTVVIPIQLALDASEVNKYKNVECKINLSDGNFTMSSINVASNRLVAGKAYQNEIAGATIMSVGKTDDALFVGTEGDFFLLTISADESLSAGDECTITLKEGLGGDVSLVETNFEPATPITATIKVVDYVTIDENEAFTPVAMTKDVHLIRSFEKDKFYTLVLPFACNASKLADAFGTAPTVYNFTGVTVDADPINELTLSFASSTGMAANRPYIIKVNEDVTNPVFSDAAIKTGATTWSQTEEDVTFAEVVFTGTYAPGTVPTGALYVKSEDSKLYMSQGGTKIKGTRAYMDISALGTVGVKAFVLSLDGEETSIDAIDTDLKAENWFDMNGRKLANKPISKGVFINNGKKVVVK